MNMTKKIALLISLITCGLSSASSSKISIKWLGGATMLIAYEGMTILTDPTLGEGSKAFQMGDPNESFDLSVGPNIKFHKRLTKLPKFNLSQVDLVILSHAHEDHFDQVAQKTIQRNTDFLVPIADVDKVKNMNFIKTSGIDWSEEKIINKNDAKITIRAVQAQHSPDLNMSKILGKGNGYWITFEKNNHKKTLYWTGDSMNTKEIIAEIKKLGTPDIFIPHLGRVGTSGPLGQISMGVDETIDMAVKIKTKLVFPIHHSTYELYLEKIDSIVEKSIGKSYLLNLVQEGGEIFF